MAQRRLEPITSALELRACAVNNVGISNLGPVLSLVDMVINGLSIGARRHFASRYRDGDADTFVEASEPQRNHPTRRPDREFRVAD